MRAAIRTFSLVLTFAVVMAMIGLPSVQSAPSDDQFQPLLTSAANPFSTTPGALNATVSLGQVGQIPLTITNADGVARTPLLYKALPTPPASAATRKVLPEPLRRVALPAQNARVDAQIASDIAAAPDGRSEFFVFLADQPDLSAAYGMTDWNARGWFVYRTLFANAERSQRDLRAWLQARGVPYRPLWIVNAIAVNGTASDLQALAGRSDVALLRANRVATVGLPENNALDLAKPGSENQAVSGCDGARCWNINQVGGYRVWSDFGVNGQGITVANIDSGVRYDHPALLQHYRGYRGPGDVQHTYNWFDATGRAVAPTDAGNHGTHTMGTMVARGNTSDQPAVGIAPGARWIAARGCDATDCAESDLMAAAQWMLAPSDPDGNNPRPDLRPQIVNNSWADPASGQTWYTGYVAAWRAAGIFPIFAAGNVQSSSCQTIKSPADYTNAVGVGATDENDSITSFSAKGPALDGTLKPDISAPGQRIPSTTAGNGLSYGLLSGTSMATPLVSGAVALLWSANPALIGDYDTTYTILTRSALPRTDARFSETTFAACSATSLPNNIYGYGRLDTYTAIARATVDVPWLALPSPGPITAGTGATINLTLDARRVPGPGTYTARLLIHADDLTQAPLALPVVMTVPSDPTHAVVRGSIFDVESGAPLIGSITVVDGPKLNTDTNGAFTVTLPPRETPYSLNASASGYVQQTQSITLALGATQIMTFLLTIDAPRLVANTTPLTIALGYGQQIDLSSTLQNNGTQPLNYTLSVSSEHYGAWRSDEPDGPAPTWIEPPPDATSLSLTDDGASQALPLGFRFPFYRVGFDRVYVSANGFLSFEPLRANQTFSPGCLPIPETRGGAILPLRADFNVTLGGKIRYAQVDAGFLVTFEDVPLFDRPTKTFTFQVLLARDGRIVLNYKQVGALPLDTAVGLQFTNVESQTLGCGVQAPLANGLTIELRPQPDAKLWLNVTEANGSIAPGQQATLPIKVSWTFPLTKAPFSGTVFVRSNDPRYPLIRLPVRFTPSLPPSTQWFPWIFK